METDLCRLAKKYGTNKADLGYTKVYAELAAKERPKRILELGIGGPGLSGGASKHAASLYMWAEYFPHAKIFAVDFRHELLINEGPIRSVWADTTDLMILTAAAREMGGAFDLIIDDAVHDPGPQTTAAHALLPFVTLGGAYVVEDFGPEKMNPGAFVEQFDVQRSTIHGFEHHPEKLIVLRP